MGYYLILHCIQSRQLKVHLENVNIYSARISTRIDDGCKILWIQSNRAGGGYSQHQFSMLPIVTLGIMTQLPFYKVWGYKRLQWTLWLLFQPELSFSQPSFPPFGLNSQP